MPRRLNAAVCFAKSAFFPAPVLRGVNFKQSMGRSPPTSKAPKKERHRKGASLFLVPEAGVEPARYRYHWILSPARLPIPSFRRTHIIIAYKTQKIKSYFKKN